MFHILFEKLNQFYESVFKVYGRFLAKHYFLIIIGAFIINFILSLGIIRMTMITDTDKLFMPSGSIAREHEKIIKDLFNSTKMSENFFLHQITDLGTWAEINFRPCSTQLKNGEFENVLQEKYINEIFKVNDYLMKNTFFKKSNSTIIGFEQVCAKRAGSCLIDGLELLTPDFYRKWLNESMYNRMKILKEQESFSKIDSEDSETNEFRFYVKQSASGASLTDLTYNLGKHFRVNLFNESENGKFPGYARAIKLRYNLKSTFENADTNVLEWEREFLKNIKNLLRLGSDKEEMCVSHKNEKSILNLVKITYGTSQSLNSEMTANIRIDVILISGTFFLIMLFSSILMSVNSNCLTSPGYLLPLSGILSAIFGITSAFGFLSYFEYAACNLIFVIPFLVFGIGIDDMFIIYSSFTHAYKLHLKNDQQTLDSSRNTFSNIISTTLSHSAVSITITSLTDFVAFLIGVTTGFKSVEIFCLYAGFSILFCYFYQLTFFSGFLCIHTRRIQMKKNSFLFCVKQTDIKCCCIPVEEKDATNQIELIEKKVEPETSSSLESKTTSTNKRFNVKKFEIFQFKKLKRAFFSFFKFMITTKKGKLITFCLYVIYLSLSIWSASRIQEGINLGDLVSEDSYYNKYVNENSELTDLNPIVMFVIYKPIDYDSNVNRIKIKKFIKNALKLDGISRDFHLNWLDSYGGKKIKYKHDDSDLVRTLKAFPPMANDVIIRKVKTKNGSFENEIIASRFYLQYSKLHFSSKDAVPMNLLRTLCLESGLPIIPFSLTFKFYEQFDETLPNILQSFVISMEAMYVISLIFIPDLISTFCIITSMCSILVGMIGLMNVWNLTLSSITMIELIMSIGFSIDFSAHVVHAFLASVGKGDRNMRAFKACTRVGLPIFNSAISTVIGICLLGLSRSYIFHTFFKSILILMALGVLNSLLFLPVLLSVIGPNWPRHRVLDKKKLNTDDSGPRCSKINPNSKREPVN